jgi:hypothetical protein
MAGRELNLPLPLEQRRALRWYSLKPDYRRRLERKGINVQSYSQRGAMADDAYANARGHGDKAKENAMAKLRRAEKKGLPIWSTNSNFGFFRKDFVELATMLGPRGKPDWNQAADLIITRSQAQKESRKFRPGKHRRDYTVNEKEAYENLPAIKRLRQAWATQPYEAPDYWYWYH